MCERGEIVSAHAKKRIKERCGIGKSASDRQAALALERGIPHSQTKGQLHKWVSGLFLKSHDIHNKHITDIRLYNNKAFLFSVDGKLVTVLNIPGSLQKYVKKSEEKTG